MICQRRRIDLDEELPRKERVPGVLRDDAQRQRIGRIGAGLAVLHIDIAALQECKRFRIQPGEVLARHGLIHGAPIHRGFGQRVADDELVLRRPAGELAGLHRQRASTRKLAFLVADRVFDQFRRAKIPIRGAEIPDSVLAKSKFVWGVRWGWHQAYIIMGL